MDAKKNEELRKFKEAIIQEMLRYDEMFKDSTESTKYADEYIRTGIDCCVNIVERISKQFKIQ